MMKHLRRAHDPVPGTSGSHAPRCGEVFRNLVRRQSAFSFARIEWAGSGGRSQGRQSAGGRPAGMEHRPACQASAPRQEEMFAAGSGSIPPQVASLGSKAGGHSGTQALRHSGTQALRHSGRRAGSRADEQVGGQAKQPNCNVSS